MPSPSYTFILTNGTTADASQVQQDFTDILNGVTDGTKDLNINALTCAGTATFNGNLIFGNSSSDTIAITAVVTSSFVFSSNTKTMTLQPTASLGTNVTYTIPDVSGNSSFALYASASSQVRCNTANGYGVVNTVIRRFTNSTTTGTAITYADSSNNGASFTITEAGIYTISYSDDFSGAADLGVSLNSSQLTTSIVSITAADRLCRSTTAGANFGSTVAVTVRLAVNDVIRPHGNASASGANAANTQFTITQVYRTA